MALKLTSSNSQYWSSPLGLTKASFGGQAGTGTGFTLTMWVRLSASLPTTSWCMIANLGSSATGGASGPIVDETGQIFCAEWSDSGLNLQYAIDGDNCLRTNGTWAHLTCVYSADGFQTLYCSTDPTTSPYPNASAQGDPETYATINIGYQSPYNTGVTVVDTSSSNVQIAEYAVYRGVLGTADVQKLWNGANPLNVQPGILQAYFPLRGDLKDYGPRHTGLTPIGGAVATFVDHPPVAPIPVARHAALAVTNTTLSIAATTKKPVSNVSGTLNESATITSTTKKPVANLILKLNESATITATTKKPVSNIVGNIPTNIAIASSTKKPVSSLAISTSLFLTITSTTKKPVANILGQINNTFVAIAATTKKPLANIVAKLNESGTITASTKKPQSIIFGFNGISGSFASTTKKPVANIIGTNVPLAITTAITATTKKPVSSLAGRIQNIIAISSTTKKPVSLLAGAVNQVATITSTTKKPISVINASNSLVLSGTITASTKKPISQLSARTVVSFPKINWID